MTEKKNDESLLDNLKAAGASIGDVVSDFAGRVREDAGDDALLERLKDAAGQARTRLSGANGGEDIKAATADFATSAEGIARELFASLRGAASEVRGSESFTQARGFVSETIGSVRGSVDEAVTKVRKDETDTTVDEAHSDASGRLDNLMENLRGDADIIDGEVIDDGK